MASRERVPYKTRALFEDKEKWKALRLEYLDAMDPTEYLFATNSKILDGGKSGNKWVHWKFICKSSYCKGDVELWREELEIKIRAKGIKGIVLSSMDGSFQAQKYLADKGWETKRGRPSKADVASEKRKAALIQEDVDELFDSAGQPNRLN